MTFFRVIKRLYCHNLCINLQKSGKISKTFLSVELMIMVLRTTLCFMKMMVARADDDCLTVKFTFSGIDENFQDGKNT